MRVFPWLLSWRKLGCLGDCGEAVMVEEGRYSRKLGYVPAAVLSTHYAPCAVLCRAVPVLCCAFLHTS